MASDVIFDGLKMFCDFDSTGDMFMTGGVMDPKELYLSDLTCTKDTKDSTSSSDSGISNLDDVADLQLDGEFKDIDFSVDFDSVIKSEALFDKIPRAEDFGYVIDKDNLIQHSGLDLAGLGLESMIKSEPFSPTLSHYQTDFTDNPCGFQQPPISPDFYTTYEYNVISKADSSSPPGGTETEQYKQNLPQHSHHGCIIQPAKCSSSVSTLSRMYTSSSPMSSPSSPDSDILSPSVATIVSPPNDTKMQSHHLPLLKSTAISSCLPSTQDNQPLMSKCQTRNILVLPRVKREVSSASPSSPGSISLSSSPSSSSHSTSTISIIPITSKPPAVVNLSAILSSKQKIQPKPGMDNVAAQSGQWISPTSLPPQVPMTAQPVISTVTCISPNSALNSLNDTKSIKRAQRIIKNRESASLSRKRKKEYLSSLEERLRACVDENQRLQRENHELKRRLDSLLEVNTQLKNPPGLSPAKKICLMCFTLFFIFNFSGYSLLSSTLPSVGLPGEAGISPPHMGRQLLSLPVSEESDAVKRMSASNKNNQGQASWFEKTLLWPSWRLQDEERIKLLAKKMNWTYGHSICAMTYINSTESTRLAEQLTGWMLQEEEKKRKKEQNRAAKKVPRRAKYYPTLRRFNPAMHSGSFEGDFASSIASKKIGGINSVQPYSVQLFKGQDQRQQFLNAIPRRNDTFYVLSFSTDYFLVPASAHNKTMRPRMSLLMPVLSSSLNDSMKSGEDNVAMMQIDCEILNTNLIHVHRSAFPNEAPAFNHTTFKQFNMPRYSKPSSHGDETSSNKSAPEHDNYWSKLKGARR